MRVGVDSGGTFTDVCLFDEATGRIEVWKVPSTPDDPSRGIVDGVAQGTDRIGGAPAAIGYFGHGTTVATNALIQHRGVKTGLITTQGFRDLLEIGRQKRPDLYDFFVDKPPTLVTRKLNAAGVGGVAIAFLYSFVHPEHEAAAKQIVAEECPDAFVCASHEIAP